MTNLTTQELKDLSIEDYADEIQGTLGNIEKFLPFTEGPVLTRTLDYLEQLEDSLASQLEEWGSDTESPDYDPDWVKRTRGFRALVVSRIRLVKRRLGVPAAPAAPGESNGRISEQRAWKRFAHILCEALDKYEEANLELDVIDVPFGDLTARQWLARRLEKEPLRTGANA